MARKKAPEEHENHERWLVSYADFITLLFAFFVVMYSISSVNEGKYRVLSDSLVSAFRSSPKSLQPIQIGALSKAPVTSTAQEDLRKAAVVRLPKMFLSQEISEKGLLRDPLMQEKYKQGADQVALKKIASKVRKALSKLVSEGLIEVNQKALWVEVQISDSVLFPSGSARLQDKAVVVIKKLAAILQEFPNPVRVEGFTDNVPIHTIVYPSNWELSTARAASVVRLFSTAGIVPNRLVAQGYGEYRPVASNKTAAGRARNRRVVIVVLADRQVEKLLNDRASIKPRVVSRDDDSALGSGVKDALAGAKVTKANHSPTVVPVAPMAATPADKALATMPKKASVRQHHDHPITLPAAPSQGLLTPALEIQKPLVPPLRIIPQPINLHLPLWSLRTVGVEGPGAGAKKDATVDRSLTISKLSHYE